jgi:alanine racemase
VHCDEQIDWLAAHKTHQPHRVFLKMNSGMNRLGFTPAGAFAPPTRLNALPQVDEISLMTHFSDADGPRGIAHQVAAFQPPRRPARRAQLCNSAATLRHGQAREVRGDWVRPGIAQLRQRARLPRARRIAHWGLQPAMTLRSR